MRSRYPKQNSYKTQPVQAHALEHRLRLRKTQGQEIQDSLFHSISPENHCTNKLAFVKKSFPSLKIPFTRMQTYELYKKIFRSTEARNPKV